MSQPEMCAQLGVLSRPDGSAIFSEDSTSVVAGIFGPVEAKNSKSLVEKAVIEAHFRPKRDLPGVKDRVNENIVKNICEAAIAVSLYPRASVVVVVQEMQNNGLLVSAALNAACLAALDAEGNVFGLRPPVNRDAIRASFVFVFDSVDRNVIASHTEGCFTADQFKDALELCREQSSYVFEFFKRSLDIK